MADFIRFPNREGVERDYPASAWQEVENPHREKCEAKGADGKIYRLISFKEKNLSLDCRRLSKIALGCLALLSTLGLAYFCCSSIRRLFSGRRIVHLGVAVEKPTAKPLPSLPPKNSSPEIVPESVEEASKEKDSALLPTTAKPLPSLPSTPGASKEKDSAPPSQERSKAPPSPQRSKAPPSPLKKPAAPKEIEVRVYTVAAVWNRFVDRETSGLSMDEKTMRLRDFVQFDERAKRLAHFISSQPADSPMDVRRKEIAKGIKAQRYKGLEREVTPEEVDAKVYSLALRLECALSKQGIWQKLEEMIPTKRGEAGAKKRGPQALLFGPSAWAAPIRLDQSLDIPPVKFNGTEVVGDWENAASQRIHVIRDGTKLGSGGMNIAYGCWDMDRGPMVWRCMKTNGDVDAWKSEFSQHKKLLELNVPHILQLYGAICVDHFPRKDLIAKALLLERCDDDLTHQRPLLWNHRTSIAKQLFESLVALHGHRRVHKDVKPENIFWKHAGDGIAVRLADFGCSAFFEDRLFNSGTLFFQPPEAWKLELKVELSRERECMLAGIDNWGAALSFLELELGDLAFPEAYKTLFDQFCYLQSALKRGGDFKAYVQSRGFKDCKLKEEKDFEFKEGEAHVDLYNRLIESYFVPKAYESFKPIWEKCSSSLDPYEQMIGHLIDPTPSERWTAQQALDHLNEHYAV